jgi:ParB family chromosome partitioning protein
VIPEGFWTTATFHGDPSHLVKLLKSNTMSEMKHLALSEIKPDPNQPRKYYDETAMKELVDSVKEKGVLQPILVRPAKSGKGYTLVCGERRYRAAMSVHSDNITKSTIPAVIRELNDEEALELQIIENLQRKDVHPLEEAVAFKSLLDHGKEVKEVAARVGKSEFYVRQRMKLNALSKEWQKVFYAGRLSITTALTVALFDAKNQAELFKSDADGSGR